MTLSESRRILYFVYFTTAFFLLLAPWLKGIYSDTSAIEILTNIDKKYIGTTPYAFLSIYIFLLVAALFLHIKKVKIEIENLLLVFSMTALLLMGFSLVDEIQNNTSLKTSIFFSGNESSLEIILKVFSKGYWISILITLIFIVINKKSSTQVK